MPRRCSRAPRTHTHAPKGFVCERKMSGRGLLLLLPLQSTQNSRARTEPQAANRGRTPGLAGWPNARGANLVNHEPGQPSLPWVRRLRTCSRSGLLRAAAASAPPNS